MAAGRDRKAPYAPIGALQEFLQRIRRENAPTAVDVAYLRRYEIAKGNEYAFISALKFLGLIDERGQPTTGFRRLQGSEEAAEGTLRDLVLHAYAPLFDAGATEMTDAQLHDWFTQHSSVSQARNAARFFRQLCRLAGIALASDEAGAGQLEANEHPEDGAPPNGLKLLRPSLAPRRVDPGRSGAADARRELIAKLPAYADWRGSPEDYRRLVELFAEMLDALNEE